jgi:hypothetical protein
VFEFVLECRWGAQAKKETLKKHIFGGAGDATCSQVAGTAFAVPVSGRDSRQTNTLKMKWGVAAVAHNTELSFPCER